KQVRRSLSADSGQPRRKGLFGTLRQRSGDKGVASVGAPACVNKEHNILTALNLRCDLAELLFTVDRLFVHLKDDHSGSQSQVITEGVRFYVRYLDAFTLRHAKALSHLRGECFDGDAQFGWDGLVLFGRGVVSLVSTVSKELGAVSHHHSRL